jgi:hypothetical protein
VEVVKAECSSCYGTGLYSGMCEAEGEAVVCIRYAGTGCEEIGHKPFVKRHGRKGIKTVRWSQGQFIATGVGGFMKSIAYSEFAKGKFPPIKEKA